MKKISNLLRKIGISELLLIITFVIFVSFIVFYFLRTKKWVNITMKVTSDRVYADYIGAPYWLISSLKVGDKEYDGTGQPVAEITDIKSYETAGYYREIYLKLKVKAVNNKTQNSYSYSAKELIIGGPISIKPKNILLEGVVSEIEGLADPRKHVTKRVYVQLEGGDRQFTTGIPTWQADSIKLGDEYHNINNKVIAKVVDKKVVPAMRTTIDNNGNLHVRQDPRLVDVYLTVDLDTIEQEGLYFFKDTEKIKINKTFSLFTEKTDISPLIIDILN